MVLPRLEPARVRELALFDVTTGLPTAVRLLRKHLGPRRTLRALEAYLWRGMVGDPLRKVSKNGWPRPEERLTRRQLRPVLLLDDVLRDDLDLPPATAQAILRDIVADTGARFIEANMPLPSLADWTSAKQPDRIRFVRQVASRFFNADIGDPTATDTTLRFDITACRFAQLTRALGRPHLAAHFCAADSAFFGEPKSPVALHRTGTIADGARCCDFRFVYAHAESPGPSGI